MNFKMAHLLENETINELVNFGKWEFWVKTIIGFPKAVTVYCVKLPFDISKINTDID